MDKRYVGIEEKPVYDEQKIKLMGLPCAKGAPIRPAWSTCCYHRQDINPVAVQIVTRTKRRGRGGDESYFPSSSNPAE